MEERADDQCQRKTVPDGGGPEHSGKRGEQMAELGGMVGGQGEGEERRASRRRTGLQDDKKLWISYPDYDLSEARSLRVGLSRRVT